jgi:asparaginyl-tRNA synthetase
MRATTVRRLGIPRTVRSVLVDAGAATGEPAPIRTEVNGWVRSLRAHKNVAFAEIDDGSGAGVQAVLKGAVRDDA